MLSLPAISAAMLPVQRVDWTGLPAMYLNVGELEIIVALVRTTQCRTMVEIGLAQGRTAKAVLRELPHLQRYIGIDTTADYRTKLTSQWTERSPEPGYLALDEPRFDRWLKPRGSLDCERGDFPASVDAVFIDGDHSREVVRHDSDLARAIVAPGGIIIWHDIHNDSVEVTDVLEQDRRAGCDIWHVKNTWLAFERRNQ